MSDDKTHGNDAAREALAGLRKGLESAKRVVEQTRFLLAGDGPCQGDALVAGGAQAAEGRGETVQNPERE